MKNENDRVGESGMENPSSCARASEDGKPDVQSDHSETSGPKSGAGESGVPPAETQAGTPPRDVPAVMRKRGKSINPLRKLREDSRWKELTPEQREKLEIWMFDEKLGYAKTLERARAEFGIEASISSVGRFYRWRVRERHAQELSDAAFTADAVNQLPVDTNELRTATVKLVGQAALKLASEKPEEIERLISLTELLLEAEQNDLRRGRLELARRCFDYEKTVATVKEIPQIRAYMQAIVDDRSLSKHEQTKKLQDLLFHWAKEVKAGNVK